MRSHYAEFPASPKWKCGPAVDQRQSFIVFAITFGSFLSIMPMGVMPKNLRSKTTPSFCDIYDQNLTSDTGIIKLKHQFNDQWSMEIGGLYENAIRNLFGITNTMTDNNRDFAVTKNFNAVPHFTMASNTASLNGHVDILGL